MAAAFDPATLDWNLLRAFVAVLEQGSLTRAAERLATSQPTLSRQIAALEAQLGAPLFERGARRLQHTALAMALAEPAQRMLAAAQALAQATDGAQRGLGGTVRLTASEVVSAHVLPAMLARLAELHPEIQVELVASNRLDNLLEREADIALRMVRPTQGSVITRHIADWPLGFFAHRDYVARHGAPTPGTMHEHRWIGYDQSPQLIDGFRAAGYAVDRRFFGLRCENDIVGLHAVAAGLGIGIALVPLARLHGALQQLLPEQPLPVLPLWLTAHRELRGSPRLKRVWDFLADELTAWPGKPTTSQ
jgi:DNA-binding transcriptional LysR family regulator